MYQKYAILRDKRGYTDYEVSKRTGISTATLTNWKYGRYKPKAEKLFLLAKLFGVTLEYFLDTSEEGGESRNENRQ